MFVWYIYIYHHNASFSYSLLLRRWNKNISFIRNNMILSRDKKRKGRNIRNQDLDILRCAVATIFRNKITASWESRVDVDQMMQRMFIRLGQYPSKHRITSIPDHLLLITEYLWLVMPCNITKQILLFPS